MRDLPSLTALRAFEAAARLNSFTLAARELEISQAAMSYHIKSLETQLTMSLFVRSNRSIALTSKGADLARSMTRAFDVMEEGLQRCRNGSTLSITTTIAFAHMWLVPRLGEFQDRHPDIQLKVSGMSDLRDLESGEYDIGIRLGRGDWKSMISEKLFDVDFTPMCSPAFLEKHGGHLEAAELPALPLIAQNDHRWSVWFSQAGHPELQRMRGLQIGNQGDVIAAARAGQGIGLVVRFFAHTTLARGELVCPFQQVSTDGTSYWICYDRARRADARIVAFRRWFLNALKAEPYC